MGKDENMNKGKEQFKRYHFRFNWDSSEPFDPSKETVEVRLTTIGGREYSANFTTKSFIDYMFEKNKRTGECAEGTYFCMPGMIIVENITEENVRTAIDDLINSLEIKNYFKPVE